MDENFVGNVIGAGIGLAVIDRISRGTLRKKKKHHKLKKLSQY